MADKEDPPQYVRAHRAKLGAWRGKTVDGGAIAAGVVVVLLAFTPTIILPLFAWVAVGVVGCGLFVGGYVAGRYRDPGTWCAPCHGALCAAVSVGIISLVSLSAALSPTDTIEVTVTTLALEGPASALLVVGLALAIGGIGGLLGSTDG